MRKVIVLIFISFLILVPYSCVQTPTSQLTLPTLQANSTPISVFDYSGQVSDGKLLISISQVKNMCYHAGETIEVLVTFENLSKETINVIDDFTFAVNRKGQGGNIAPLLSTESGTPLYQPADFQIFDTGLPATNSLFSLSAGKAFHSVVEYEFPKFFVTSTSNEILAYSTPGPGQYLLRFVYLNYQKNVDAWRGAIGSNQIDICILN